MRAQVRSLSPRKKSNRRQVSVRVKRANPRRTLRLTVQRCVKPRLQPRPGSAAEAALVEKHLPLVRTVVGRVALTLPQHVNREDLYSSGLVGLLNAVRNFDPRNRTSFETYARVRIRGSVLDELRRMDWVPRSVHSKARKVETVMRQQEQLKGHLPTNEEMAEALDLSLDEYEQLLAEIRPATFVCLDAVQESANEDGTSYYETVADLRQQDPVDQTSRHEMAELISDRLATLPEMQRKVLALYYYEDMRLREIAEVFHLTESRICQIHSQAILAIRASLNRLEPVAA